MSQLPQQAYLPFKREVHNMIMRISYLFRKLWEEIQRFRVSMDIPSIILYGIKNKYQLCC